METEPRQTPTIIIGGKPPEPFALCMVCEEEHSSDEQICPKCGLTLSVVRRCPGCERIVSAKHKRCIYCSYPLTEEDTQHLELGPSDTEIAKARLRRRELIEHRIRVRSAAVTICTFVLVFVLGAIFLRRMTFGNDSQIAETIATSYVVRSTETRHSPAATSAEMQKLAPSDIIEIQGFRIADQGSRWVEIARGGATGFLPVADIAPPKVSVPGKGQELLKFYLAGMTEPELVPEATRAVDYFAKAYPQQPGIGELRWLLAERARHLASKASAREAMLKEARGQYEILAQGSGDYAERARRALSGNLSPAVDRTVSTPASRPSQPDLQIVDGQSEPQKYAGFSRNPAHEVLLVDRSTISVAFELPAKLQGPSVLRGRVTRPIYVGKMAAIPAGSACEVRLTPVDTTRASATLVAITVRNHRYDIQSTSVDMRLPSGSSPANRTADFALESPVAITR